MGKLPNINDSIYRELEQINNITNRFAYECAIRNENVIKLKKEIQILIEDIRSKLLISIMTENCFLDDIEILDKLDEHEFIFNKNDITSRLLDKYTNGYLLPSFKKFIEEKNETKLIKEKNEILLKEYWLREYYEQDIIEYIFSDNEFIYHVSEPYHILSSNFSIGKTRTYITKFHKELGIINSEDILFPLAENIEDYNKPFREDINYNIYCCSIKNVNLEKLNLLSSTKRLIIPKDLNPSINIQINPYHINDVKEQFNMIMKTLKENKSIVMVQKEIDLIEKYSKGYEKNKKIKAKRIIADMLFVYDFSIVFQEKTQSINEKINYYNKLIEEKNDKNTKLQELKEDLERIKSEPRDFYTKDKIQDIKNEINEEEIKSKKLINNPTTNKKSENNIFITESFKKSSNNMNSHTAYSYYDEIQNNIEQLKYKEFLTGLKL